MSKAALDCVSLFEKNKTRIGDRFFLENVLVYGSITKRVTHFLWLHLIPRQIQGILK